MKTIIFDIDGTLFDTKPGIIACLNDVLSCFDLEPIKEDEQDKYIGPSVKDSFIKYHKFDDKKADEATKMYREKYVNRYIKGSMPYEGISEVIEYIKHKKYTLCIATMKTRKQIDTLLELFDMDKTFDSIETAREDGGYTKSEMLENIKKQYKDSEYVFVGDTNGDYKAALKAGIPFVYARYGYGDVSGETNTIDALIDMIKLL